MPRSPRRKREGSRAMATHSVITSTLVDGGGIIGLTGIAGAVGALRRTGKTGGRRGSGKKPHGRRGGRDTKGRDTRGRDTGGRDTRDKGGREHGREYGRSRGAGGAGGVGGTVHLKSVPKPTRTVCGKKVREVEYTRIHKKVTCKRCKDLLKARR